MQVALDFIQGVVDKREAIQSDDLSKFVFSCMDAQRWAFRPIILGRGERRNLRLFVIISTL